MIPFVVVVRDELAHGRPEERVAVMDEELDVLQESVLGIGGVPHELGDPRPVGLGADARDLTAAAGQVKRVRPRGVQTSTVKQSAAASTSQWAARNSRQVVRFLRSGAGSRPRSLRTLAMVPRAT